MNQKPVDAAAGKARCAAALLCCALALPLLSATTAAIAATAAPAADGRGGDGRADAGPSGSNPVLLAGEGVEVTAADVLAEAARAPQATRDELLSNPNHIAQIASNIYVRRALAAEAVKEGLLADPVIEAQLKIARDRVLSDAQLARVDEKNRPAAAVTEQYAKTVYQADPKRFAAPDEVHARHILIAGSGDESRSKAERLLAELKKSGGADFEAVARNESADPGSAQQGGDLGFFSRGRMVKPFEDAAFELQNPGELSGVVESPFGFHIIQLIERRSAGTRPFAEVEGPLRAEAAQKVATEARTAKAKVLLADAQFNRDAIEALATKEQQHQQKQAQSAAPTQPQPPQK